jgi:hypothetical protein
MNSRTSKIFWIANGESRHATITTKLYCWLFNYLEYVKDFDLNVHVRVFKVSIIANSEGFDVKTINLFNFTLIDIMSD